jgi:hypothetical protein
MVRFGAILAIIAGLSLAAIKLLLAESLWWPFVVVEYLAAVLLLAGAVVAWRSGQTAMLAAGWGFTAGITWSTLFHHLQKLAAPGAVELGLAGLLLTAFAGIALAVAPVRTVAT